MDSGAGIATDVATTISHKSGETLVLSDAQLQGKDWMLADLQERSDYSWLDFCGKCKGPVA